MDVIADNLANAYTTRTPGGGPFHRRLVALTQAAVASPGAWEPAGVRVAAILEDPAPPRLRYQPGHPDADANGFVAYPNVDVVTEMVDLIAAVRAYEANVTSFNAAKQIFLDALEIGRA